MVAYMKKRLILMLLVLTVWASACGNGASDKGEVPVGEDVSRTEDVSGGSETPDSESGEESDDSAGEDASGGESGDGAGEEQVVYPVTVTDQLGRQVTIERKPETIASGYYISTSLLLALDLQEKIVGVEAKAGSRAIYRLSAPDIIELPNIGTAKEFDLEGCAALAPDLVIVPARLKDTIPSIEALGLTVIAVNPEDRELLEEATLLLGTATDTLSAANALLQYTSDQLSILADVLRDTDTSTVYLASNSALLSTAGTSMYQNNLIENAGGANVAAQLTEDYWTEVSYEQLLAWNPEYIILAADAGYTVESVMEDPALAECDAVQNGHVYQLPGDIESWDSPVPGSVLGSLWLASVLHPEEYSVEEWEKAVTEFYETFYRFTPEL